VSISLETGHIDDLFDPNPEYRDLELGVVRSLRWKNAFGLDTFGKLVLPAHATPGTRLPLIVVGYQSEGFLRGGVGDDYPIQLFAAHGYAVLSYERPPVYGLVRGKTEMEAMQLDTRDWTDYRNVLSSIETEVSALIDEGIVDRDRVGLTGFSNGASVAQFAMVNSKLFRAYAVSHCCEEPVGVVTTTGPVGNRYFSQMGYPKLTDSPSTFWEAMSIRLNAAKLNAPVLMQLSDDEYLGALEGFQALKEQGKPAEMYVFPDEHHIKWQPAHRAAQYQRSLDWFDFWLRNIEDPDPSKVNQYQRWRALRGGISKQ
jgi:dipeptidyl aminopeptidase/acylaminoacyl peptidase